jgi:hypothetical protein
MREKYFCWSLLTLIKFLFYVGQFKYPNSSLLISQTFSYKLQNELNVGNIVYKLISLPKDTSSAFLNFFGHHYFSTLWGAQLSELLTRLLHKIFNLPTAINLLYHCIIGVFGKFV